MVLTGVRRQYTPHFEIIYRTLADDYTVYLLFQLSSFRAHSYCPHASASRASLAENARIDSRPTIYVGAPAAR